MGARTRLTMLALPLLCMGVGAAGAADPPTGRISEALAREARRLAEQQTSPAPDPAGWAQVVALQPGAEVTVVVRGGGELHRRFVSADGTTLVVSSANAARADEKIARGEINEIRELAERRGSYVAGIIAGGLTFTLAGLPIGLDIAMNEQCQPRCGWAKTKVALSLVALPIGAGYVAYKAFGRRTERVIYRVANP